MISFHIIPNILIRIHYINKFTHIAAKFLQILLPLILLPRKKYAEHLSCQPRNCINIGIIALLALCKPCNVVLYRLSLYRIAFFAFSKSFFSISAYVFFVRLLSSFQSSIRL